MNELPIRTPQPPAASFDAPQAPLHQAPAPDQTPWAPPTNTEEYIAEGPNYFADRQKQLEELQQHGRDKKLGRQIFELASSDEATPGYLSHERPSPHIKVADNVVKGEAMQPMIDSINRGLANPGDVQAEDLMYGSLVELGKEKQEAEKEAVTDELTGLLNRRGILDKLDMILSDPGLNTDRFILMYMDLNGFKQVNDTHGHQAGDKVLKAVAKRLKLRNSDTAARIGGDEFIVIVDTEVEAPDRRGDDREDTLPRRIKKDKTVVGKGLTAHLVEEVHQGGLDAGYAGISASVGVQELNGERDASAIINKADQAMQLNKSQSKSGR